MLNRSAHISEAFNQFVVGRDCKRLSMDEEDLLGFSRYTETWEVIFPLDGALRAKIYICFSEDFPLVLPRIYLSEESYEKYKYIPHIDSDRLICTFDTTATSPLHSEPFQVVNKCYLRAMDIIEQGLAGLNFDDFEEEFIAYWGQEYEGEPPPQKCVSFISEELPEDTSEIFILNLKKPHQYAGYSTFLFTTEKEIASITNILNFRKIPYYKSKAFFFKLGSSIIRPPFNLAFEESLTFIDSYAQRPKKFENFINNNDPCLVVFSKEINNSICYFGWRYENLEKRVNGFRKSVVTNYKIINDFQKNDPVRRCRFENVTQKRLINRSSGKDNQEIPNLDVSLIGLGSVGSHLLHFLKSLNPVHYRLIDNDVLSTENIGRHLLGFQDVNQLKVVAIERWINLNAPTTKVSPSHESIVKLLYEDIDFLNETDYIFVTIGNDNVEALIGQALQEGTLRKPTFFVWVEPYLLGAHMIYINPASDLSYSDFFEDDLFKHNIINNADYKKSDNEVLKVKEAGCQTSYTPYSCSDTMLFLSALFPVVVQTIKSEDSNSFSCTWVGDLSFIPSKKGININTTYCESQQGQLIIRK